MDQIPFTPSVPTEPRQQNTGSGDGDCTDQGKSCCFGVWVWCVY